MNSRVSGLFAWRGTHRGDENRRMTEPGALSDEELLNRAHEWRLRALRGDRDARGAAHLHEVEVRRRFGVPTEVGAIEAAKPKRRPFWKLWSRG